MKPKCSVDNCSTKVLSKGYCSLHYHRQLRGLPLTDKLTNADRVCLAGNCDIAVVTHGYCRKHWWRIENYGDVNHERTWAVLVCKVKDCTRSVTSFGYCRPHWDRLQKYGHPEKGERVPYGKGLAFLKTLANESRVTPKKECVLWPYPSAPGAPYGRTNYKGETWLVHRLSLALFSKHHVVDRLAAHKCGNPFCVNPKHLYWATYSENAEDKLAHGTDNRGEQHPFAKLTKEQVLKIYNSRASRTKLGERYGVDATNIHAIQTGRSWGWLTQPEKHKDAKTRSRELRSMA